MVFGCAHPEKWVKLKEKGAIERIGPDKGGYWKITKKFIK